MTLVLTEASPAGLVMVADSAITKIDGTGRIREIDQQGWVKVLRAPTVKAGVAYWGHIGRIHNGRFDTWMRHVLDSSTYGCVRELAQVIADAFNKACGNQPLGIDQCVGAHVAGYDSWSDGVRRPVIVHVHNGPGHYVIRHRTEPLPAGERLTEVSPLWVGGPRNLFAPHQDFPSTSADLKSNLLALRNGFILRNGDFFLYSVVWDSLQRAFNYLNLIDGVSVPRDPQSLGSRRGLMIAALETTVRVFRCSNQSRIVGGKVTAEAIGPHGYLA